MSKYLYLSNRGLSLICIMKEENLERPFLFDYNVT